MKEILAGIAYFIGDVLLNAAIIIAIYALGALVLWLLIPDAFGVDIEYTQIFVLLFIVAVFGYFFNKGL